MSCFEPTCLHQEPLRYLQLQGPVILFRDICVVKVLTRDVIKFLVIH